MTVAELESRIDVRELEEWIVAESENVPRLEMLVASLCSMFYNANRDPRRSRPLEASDFLGVPRPKREYDPKRVERQLKQWAMMKGAITPDAYRRA